MFIDEVCSKLKRQIRTAELQGKLPELIKKIKLLIQEVETHIPMQYIETQWGKLLVQPIQRIHEVKPCVWFYLKKENQIYFQFQNSRLFKVDLNPTVPSPSRNLADTIRHVRCHFVTKSRCKNKLCKFAHFGETYIRKIREYKNDEEIKHAMWITTTDLIILSTYFQRQNVENFPIVLGTVGI
jgi:hypothetical protein